jgi:hypothetical protein
LVFLVVSFLLAFYIKLYYQFNNDGSVLETKRRKPSSVRSAENIDAIRVALQRSPSKSTRKAAALTA